MVHSRVGALVETHSTNTLGIGPCGSDGPRAAHREVPRDAARGVPCTFTHHRGPRASDDVRSRRVLARAATAPAACGARADLSSLAGTASGRILERPR